MGIWPARPFQRAVASFFMLVLFALVIATLVNGPLAFDGAYNLFRALDTHHIYYDNGLKRVINIPLQLPLLIAMQFTENMRVLCLTFSAAYTSIQSIGLAVSWLVCKRRPSLFVWPAMSMCVAKLPGLFFFYAESNTVVTLLWPALLTGLMGAPPVVMALVATLSVVAALSHPIAAPILALALLVTVASAIIRPQMRRANLGFALMLGLLLVVRIATPLHEWERNTYSAQIALITFRIAVKGWPLAAIAFIVVAVVGCLVPARQRSSVNLMVPLVLAGAALVAWASKTVNWANCLDYRYWFPSIALLLMSAAAFEVLCLRSTTESRLQETRLYAMPLLGAIFLVVLSIQSLEWQMMSLKLREDLVTSDGGCIPQSSLVWLQDTALNHWSTALYAIELQGRKPSTLVLPNQSACRLFESHGDAMFVDQGEFSYFRTAGKGWFELDDAYRKAKLHRSLD